jgi:hypothetical protein
MRKSPLLIAILGALSACKNTEDGKACMEVVEEQTTCTPGALVNPRGLFILDRCGWEVEEVKSNGTRETIHPRIKSPMHVCCYVAELVEEGSNCGIDTNRTTDGRPYFDGGKELRAPLLSHDATLSPASARAEAWAIAGSGEHASVAAFARLSLQLLRLGAPSDLLRGVHQAAMDELSHAEICWAMARRFGAPPVSAGPFPFPDSIPMDADLPALAAAAVHEGCLAETLGAHVDSVAAELAPEPDVQSALRNIAREEATHAVLSFRIVAWALRVGGAAVKSAVHAAFTDPWPKLDVAELALRANVDVALLPVAAEQGVAEVIRPAAAELLAA